MEIIQKWLMNFEILIAGLIGSIVAVPFQKNMTTKTAVVVFIVTGASCAHYLTSIVSALFAIAPQSDGGVGFLLGAFGGSLMSAITRAVQNADLWSLIKQRLGGDNSNG